MLAACLSAHKNFFCRTFLGAFWWYSCLPLSLHLDVAIDWHLGIYNAICPYKRANTLFLSHPLPLSHTYHNWIICSSNGYVTILLEYPDLIGSVNILSYFGSLSLTHSQTFLDHDPMTYSVRCIFAGLIKTDSSQWINTQKDNLLANMCQWKEMHYFNNQ